MGTRSPGASVGHRGSVHTSTVGPSRAPVVTDLVVAMRMSTVHSSSLTEHLLPWLMDLEQGTQTVEVCDSTLLQTDPIMGFPIPVSVPDIWEGRNRMSARTFNLPGMCRARHTIRLA